MIKFDFETYNNINLDNYDLSHVLDKFYEENIMSEWYELNTNTKEIKEYADKIRKDCDVFIVIGIGGSYLGSKAVIDALTPYFDYNKPEIVFAGTNLSSDYINDLINYIDGKSVYVNVISKSGNTLETLINYDIILKYMINTYINYKERIIVTTNSKSGQLLESAKKNEFKVFEVPENIGGRYSVLSVVGLLPISVAGINIDELLKGAIKCKGELDNCYKYTSIRNEMIKYNKIIESFDIYEPKLYYFTEWLKQLFAESQGKNSHAILPVSTVNTRDLHSLGQYYQEGNPIIFSTTIFSNSTQDIYVEKYNKNLNDINKIVMESVSKAHNSVMNTNIIELDNIDEENMGYLIFFFEMSAMMGSYLIDVKYYNQPGVNNYKEIVNQII